MAGGGGFLDAPARSEDLALEGPAADGLGTALALPVKREAGAGAGAGRLARTSALHCSRKDSSSGLDSDAGPDILGTFLGGSEIKDKTRKEERGNGLP